MTEIYDDQLVYVDAIFQIAWEADNHEMVFWRPGEGEKEWRAFALCNDLFYWACADAEEVRPEDVLLLRQTLTDLQAIEKAHPTDLTPGQFSGSVATAYLADLYACRKRGLRPQAAFYRTTMMVREPPELTALFDAAGPERDDPDGKKRTVYDQEATA